VDFLWWTRFIVIGLYRVVNPRRATRRELHLWKTRPDESRRAQIKKTLAGTIKSGVWWK
jgi:hypothetical protein